MRIKGELCESAKMGRCCIDDICRGADVTLCGFDKEFYDSEIRREQRDDDYDDDPEFDKYDDPDHDGIDCHMDKSGVCEMAGTEDCAECPYMLGALAEAMDEESREAKKERRREP